MILISLILLTICYYLLLWYFQRKRQKAFQVAALEVIGPTKQLPIASIDKEAIFGATTSLDTDSSFAVQKQDPVLKVMEQTERTAIFETASRNGDATNEREGIQEIQSPVNTDIAVQESLSDINTREELNLIATELGYYEDQKKIDSAEQTDLEQTDLEQTDLEQTDLEQMMKVFDGFTGLYEQEIQEVIEYNIKSPS